MPCTHPCLRQLAWSAGTVPATAHVPLAEVKTAFPAVNYSIKVTNTGPVAGKETVMAYWTPPDEVDPVLKQQLFAFQSAVLEPGASATLQFNLPAPEKLASVTEMGDRVFMPGTYKVRFTRGHGEPLNATVTTTGQMVQLSQFPRRWVSGHAVTVDACVEGITDVVSTM